MPPPRTGIVSFDVFDTVLTRLVGHPSSVYLLVGMAASAEALVDMSPLSFRWRRRIAEGVARNGAAGGEPGLLDIYRAMLPSASTALVRRLAELELTVESLLVRGNPHARAAVARARLTDTVVFISDTYLSSDFVRHLLVREQVADARDGVYVSCEHARSKRRGELFAVVSTTLGPLVSHTGDDVRGDVNPARTLAIPAVHYREFALTRYEAELERHAAATNGLTSVFAGISRLARLRSAADGIVDHRLAALSGVIAPLLVSYVTWVLQHTERLGASRLAFVARDGFLPTRIAGVLRPDASRRIRYIAGSRQAWSFAAYSLGEEPLPSWVTRGIAGRPFAAIVARLRLSLEECPTMSRVSSTSWSRLSTEGRTQVVRELVSRPDVLALVRARSTEQRALLVSYLRQHGIGDDEWVLADLGHSGSSAAALTAVLRATGLAPPTFLYLELTRPADLASAGVRWDAFISVAPDDGGFGPWPGPAVQLLESVVTAPQGQVLGFRRAADGHVEADLAAESNVHAERWQWRVLADAVERWAADFGAVSALLPHPGDPRPALMRVLQDFVLRPTRDEAAAWGARCFADSPQDDDARPLASRLTVRDSVRFGLTGKLPTSFWPQATMVLLPPWRRIAHRCLALGRRAARVAVGHRGRRGAGLV